MAAKVCVDCGGEYDSKRRSVRCPECAKRRKYDKKNEYVRRVTQEERERIYGAGYVPRKGRPGTDIERVCKDCGAAFRAGISAQYCPVCAERRRSKVWERHIARKRDGTVRKIGSTGVCVRCGGEYIIASGRQKYCKNCAEAANMETANEAAKQHYQKHKDEINAAKRQQTAERQRRLAQAKADAGQK